jgi:hypothetical protein
MSGVRKGRPKFYSPKGPPKFSPPSGDVKRALQTMNDEVLAYALRTYKSAEPVAWPTPAYETAVQIAAADRQRRIEELYKHYELDIADPLAAGVLVLWLASDLIPNFEPFLIGARGRPRSVIREHHSLAIAIEALQTEDNRRDLFAACRILARSDGPWKSKPPKELQAASYRYQEQIRAIRAHLPAQAVAIMEAKLKDYEK